MATKIDTSEERIAETWEEAIFLAHLDHALLVGSEIVIPWLFHCEGNDVQGEFTVRLLPADAQDLERNMDTHLDPYWDIEPLCEESKRIFANAEADDKWMWAGGPSYKILEAN